MAHIRIENDLGVMTLSETLRPSSLEDGNYAAKLVERVGWALSDADASETVDCASQVAWRDPGGDVGPSARTGGGLSYRRFQRQNRTGDPEGVVLLDSDRLSEGGSRPSIGEERDHAGDLRDQAGDLRDTVGDERDRAADQRDHAGDLRDRAGEDRDVAGDYRDHAAELRDQAAEQSEAAVTAPNTTDSLDRSQLARRYAASDRKDALRDRHAGASERTRSERDRETALIDRGVGASARTQAELDRSTAHSDRGASAKEREYSSLDDLTGVYRRGAGFVEFEREIARAKRSAEPLVVAFVDVDGLKAVNGSLGHAGGDRLLRDVAKALKARLRSHDLIIRYGGDEFVCALSGLTMADATKRFALVNAALLDAPSAGSITVGLAALAPDESLESVLARADAALYRERQIKM